MRSFLLFQGLRVLIGDRAQGISLRASKFQLERASVSEQESRLADRNEKKKTNRELLTFFWAGLTLSPSLSPLFAAAAETPRRRAGRAGFDAAVDMDGAILDGAILDGVAAAGRCMFFWKKEKGIIGK